MLYCGEIKTPGNRMQIKKAVFPVAGLGTRFLPATKANPKEMLPVVDKPLIQYAVEEAIDAGIEHMIFVTSSSKRAIEDHFDSHFELETKLREANKDDLLKTVQGILPKGINCSYIRQPVALGLGHAVLCAKPLVGNEPFAVILADDMIYTEIGSCMRSMVEIANENESSVVAVEKVPWQDVHKYGVIAPGQSIDQQIHTLTGIVEKPPQAQAPSDLAVVGRYVLHARIFSILENTHAGASNEIQLTDAIAELLREQKVLGYEFTGTRYDCGSKLGYLKATVEYALRHPELKQGFSEYIHTLNQ